MKMSFFPLASMLLALLAAGCSDEAADPQGFAGLGQAVDTDGPGAFAKPRPGDRIQLSADLGPHPDYRIEWWYLTANLTTEKGEPLGLQWTQFRQALKARQPGDTPPGPDTWPLQSVWMAHAALSRPDDHHFSERLARGDIGQAGAQAQPFRVWLDDWALNADAGRDRWHLKVDAGDWGYDLTLAPQRAPVRHGDQGFSAKSSSGEGSMYFSYVDLAIDGTVTLSGRTVSVSGRGWFDREWSSQFLRADQQGWDWMALQLDSGDRIMAFRLREDKNAFLSGTWISANGEVIPMRADDFNLEPIGQRAFDQGDVPSRWHLDIPSQHVDIDISAMAGNFWNTGLYPYWESPVVVEGTHTGKGYLELTGYAQ